MKLNIKILFIISFFSISLLSIDFTKKKGVNSFIKFISKNYQIDEKFIIKLFNNIRKNDKIAFNNNKKLPHLKETNFIKTYGKWSKYARNHIGKNRIIYGVKFLEQYKFTLNKIYEIYKVSPEYIVAIIGVETLYGNQLGEYYVFDHLVKLAFSDDRRAKFFKSELKELFKLYKNKKVDILNLIGSSAGAIGLGQFMPSAYNNFGRDFNYDNVLDMMNPLDSIASIANYFKEHNWKDNQPVAVRAYYRDQNITYKNIGLKFKHNIKNLKKSYIKNEFKYYNSIYLIELDLGSYNQLWYTTNNFYSITRYNHSSYYAMAIFQLAQNIKKAYIKKYKKFIIDK